MLSRCFYAALIFLVSGCFDDSQVSTESPVSTTSPLVQVQDAQIPPTREALWLGSSRGGGWYPSAQEACMSYNGQHDAVPAGTNAYGSPTSAACDWRGGDGGFPTHVTCGDWVGGHSYQYIGDVHGGVCVYPTVIDELVKKSRNSLSPSAANTPITYQEVQNFLAAAGLPTGLSTASYNDKPLMSKCPNNPRGCSPLLEGGGISVGRGNSGARGTGNNRTNSNTPSAQSPIKPLNQLLPEVKVTINRIKQGGPFKYSQDGTEFMNREGLLPQKPLGYYKEYTVETPGATNRGARRIVIGNQGEIYYTPDHYGSFTQIQ